MQSETELFSDLFQSINFELRQTLKIGKSGYFVFEGIWRERPVTLKVASKENHLKLAGMKKERLISDLLAGSGAVVTGVIDAGEFGEYEWIIREFFSGDALADAEESAQKFFSHPVQAQYDDNHGQILESLRENLEKFASASDSRNYEQLHHNRFALEFSNEEIEQISAAFNADISNVAQFYLNNLRPYSSAKRSLSVGDLTPLNILIDHQGRVVLSDFEWTSFDIYLMDIAFLWLFLWEKSLWQEDIIKIFVITDEDKLTFRLSIVRSILGLFLKNIDKGSKLTDHIWVRYLAAATGSFEELLKVKD